MRLCFILWGPLAGFAGAAKVALVLEQVKEGFAEPLQASYVELVAGELGLSLTLGIVGRPMGPNGRPWLSDPTHELLKHLKPYIGHLDVAIQGFDDDATAKWWNEKEAALVSNDVAARDFAERLASALDVADRVFAYKPSTFMPPVALPCADMANLTNGSLAALLNKVANDTGFNLTIAALSDTAPAGCRGGGLFKQTAVVRMNSKDSDHCGPTPLSQVKATLQQHLKEGGTAILVLSPLDLAGGALFGKGCSGESPTTRQEIAGFLQQLKDESGITFTKLCELSGSGCFSDFPLWPADSRLYGIYVIEGLIAVSILVSIASSLATWLILGSALWWAGRRHAACPWYWTCLFVLPLVLVNGLFAYMMLYFICSFVPGLLRSPVWAPLDALGIRDVTFEIIVFTFCLPLFFILFRSFSSLRRWTKWSKAGADFDCVLRRGRAPNFGEQPPKKAVIVVPVHQENWEAFLRMVHSATHSDYQFDGRPHFELLIVFDGLEKNGQFDGRPTLIRLEKTRQCRDALKEYLRNFTESSIMLPDATGNLIQVPYIVGWDPDTQVKVHALTPPWGGKWSAQRCAWCMLKDKFGQEPLLLFIDSDCAVKQDGLRMLARCMTEKRETPFVAVAGHIKVDMRNERYNFLWKMQETDFIISQMMVRGCEDSLGAVSCLPGAFCMLRWGAFAEVADTYFTEVKSSLAADGTEVIPNYWEWAMVHIAEDRYLTLLLLQKAKQGAIAYCPLAEASTECPSKVEQLLGQRRRWFLSAVVNDTPMCLSPTMWKNYKGMMLLRLWTVIMTSVPANGFQVGLLSVLGMYLRGRVPDLGLVCLTVFPLYLSMLIYCLVLQRRGPIVYTWVFMLVMPLFNMYVGLKSCLQWRSGEKPGWEGGREAAGTDAAAVAVGPTPPATDTEVPATAGAILAEAAAPPRGHGRAALEQGLLEPSTQARSFPVFVRSGGNQHQEAPPGFLSQHAQTFDARLPQTQPRSFVALLAGVPGSFSVRDMDTERGPPVDLDSWRQQRTLNFRHESDLRLRPDTLLTGISFFRCLAAVHIVLFHYYKFYPQNPFGFIHPETNYWITWGGQWVQFFFMLSGFMSTYTRLVKPPRAEPWLSVWYRGMQKVYPAYFVSIFIWVMLKINQYDMTVLVRTLPAQLLLIFNWWPQMACYDIDPKTLYAATPPSGLRWFCVSGVNEPAWYLGSLQLFWMLFPLVFPLVDRLSQLRVAFLLLISWSLCLVWPFLLTFINPEEGSPLRTLQEFNPVSHFHKFVFGMCLARFYVDFFCRGTPEEPRRKFLSDLIIGRVAEAPLFTPLALVVIGLMFFTSPIDSFSFMSLSSYEFVLLPLFALLVVGVSLQQDYFSALLGSPCMRWIEDYDLSYEIYILQGCAMELCTQVMGLFVENVNHMNPQQLTIQRVMYPFVLIILALLVNRNLKQCQLPVCCAPGASTVP